jgi:hypothetical protein
MPNDSMPERIGSVLVAILLWPLRSIERTRGWRLVGLLALYGLVASLVAGLLWRRSELAQVPDIGEPFDVPAHRSRSRVADDLNAFIPYRRAVQRCRDLNDAEGAAFNQANLEWARADNTLRGWVAEHDEAIDLFREGSQRPEAYLEVPADLKGVLATSEKAEVIRRLSWIGDAALFKAGKLQSEGDLVGSWAMLKAVVRTSRHMIRALPTNGSQNTSTILVQFANEPVARWSKDPAASITLLRQALDDLVAAEALTPPLSLTYREGYLAADGLLDDWQPLLAERARTAAGGFESNAPGLMAFLRGEPERSRRVLRMLIANDLRWCDQPPGARPPFVERRLKIYGPDSTSTAVPLPLPAGELARLTDSSLVAPALAWRLDDFDSWAKNDRWSLGRLKESIAIALFRREMGRPPASPAEAIRRYLPAPGDTPDRDEAESIGGNAGPRDGPK